MTKEEMIRKYKLELADGGIKAYGKLTKKAVTELKAAKPELLVLLKKQEQAKVAQKIKAEEERKQEIARQEPIKELALIISGHYLMDCDIQYVVPLTAEEKSKYREDFAKNNLFFTARENEKINVKPVKSSDLAKNIQGRKSDGYLAYGESVVWLISGEEKNLIVADLHLLKAAKEAKETEKKERKQARLTASQAEAEKTGKPVVINSYITEECMNRSEDCSFDQATVYMRPDGSTFTKYICCH